MPGAGQDSPSESESTATAAGTETETDTDTDDADTYDPGKLDSGPGPELKPQQLVIALGRGIVDGAASFAPPQHFSITPGLGLTTLYGTAGASYLAHSDGTQVCLASVSRQGDVVTLEWHECVQVAPIDPYYYWIWDVARMDANDDGSDELVLMKPYGRLDVFPLDPVSPSRLAEPTEIETSAIWERPFGLTTGPLDDVPGDEAVAAGTEGDPVSGGMVNQVVILHGGQSHEATVIEQAYGRPHLAELTGDDRPDLLVGSKIYRGTGDVDLVEEHLTLSSVTELWTLDAQGDGIDDVARVQLTDNGCPEPGFLELQMGPFEALPEPIAVDGTRLDLWSEILPGDLDHDGVDELVSVGANEGACSGAAHWTITSVETGTSDPIALCEAADNCGLVERPHTDFSYAAELMDVDGDGNLDLAALIQSLD